MSQPTKESTMPKRAVSTDQATPPGGPYSQAVVAGDTVYLAGAIPALPDGTRVGRRGQPGAGRARRGLSARFR
jgi:2-iminobutanoate/2-iminopropanoate deaminase